MTGAALIRLDSTAVRGLSLVCLTAAGAALMPAASEWRPWEPGESIGDWWADSPDDAADGPGRFRAHALDGHLVDATFRAESWPAARRRVEALMAPEERPRLPLWVRLDAVIAAADDAGRDDLAAALIEWQMVERGRLFDRFMAGLREQARAMPRLPALPPMRGFATPGIPPVLRDR